MEEGAERRAVAVVAERLGDQPGQLHEVLATVRPLGPGGSWDGLGVVRWSGGSN
jgi:hypothetical protein